MASTIQITPPTETVTLFRSLTTQEAHILAFALHGLSSEEMAGKFVISKLTVSTHRRNIMSKWNLAHLHSCSGKRAANEMLATIRPYAATYLPHV